MPIFARFAVLRTTLIGVATLCVAGIALAQELNIPLIAAPPELADFIGMTPSEAVRGRWALVTGFTRREPTDGARASQSTNAYLGYVSRKHYAVFVAHVDDPASRRNTRAARDILGADDRMGWVVDTVVDRRSGYAFSSSPL